MTFSIFTQCQKTWLKVLGQGQRWQETRSKVKVTGVRVVGQGQMSQGSRSKVIGQGHRNKVKFAAELFYTINLWEVHCADHVHFIDEFTWSRPKIGSYIYLIPDYFAIF